jgi:uroporphyrinogen-III synthase
MAEKLEAKGYRAFIEPLLTIRMHDGPEVSFDGVQAILATSANGVRAISRRTHRRDVPVFAVGPQTAEAANAQGFHIVRDADGDTNALAGAVAKWTTPDKGTLFHAAGAEAPKLLASRLTDAGFDVRSETLYEAKAVSKLPAALEKCLATGKLEGAIFMSPRSAQIFADLVTKSGLSGSTRALTAYCISEATAKALALLQFGALRIAAKPNQPALLSLVC